MNALSVSIGEVEIGVLEHFDDETECFTFNERYLSSTLDVRPVLGQIFEDRIPNPIAVGGPIGWFSHLLPQGAMRHWRSKLYGIDDDDSFRLLCHLGDNLPGAVVMRQTEALSRGSRSTSRPAQADTGVDDERFRFSLAGAQWKMSARSSGRGLTTNANASGIEYVAKFHSPEFPDLPQCEFATMKWAQESGIKTPEFELRNVSDFDAIPPAMPTGNGNVYVCRRFDRFEEKRIHMEDFGQILDRPPGQDQYRGSYEEIAKVVHWLAPDSIAEFLKLLVFNLFSGNGDAHLKNFSILYSDGRTATLAPAYDLVATIVYYKSGGERLALKLGGSDHFNEISFRQFSSLFKGIEWDVQYGRTFVLEAVDRVVSAWNQPQVREDFSQSQRSRLDSHVRGLQGQLWHHD